MKKLMFKLHKKKKFVSSFGYFLFRIVLVEIHKKVNGPRAMSRKKCIGLMYYN